MKKYLVITFILIVLGLAIAVGLKGEPTEDFTPAPFTVRESNVNNWGDITPGKTEHEEVIQELGPLLSQESAGDGKVIYNYDLIGKYSPLQVGVDQEGVVEYVRVPQTDVKPGALSSLKKEFNLGNADLEMYLNGSQYVKVLVYLDEGIALEVNEGVGEVYRIRYFEPMEQSEFLRVWGSDLTFESRMQGH